MHEHPAPDLLRTDRCWIRPLRLDDAGSMAQAVQGSMEHLDRWVRVGPRLATELLASQEIRRVTAEWWADTNYVLGVFDEGGSVVGGTGFHPRGGALGTVTTEIGMWIAASHSGRGPRCCRPCCTGASPRGHGSASSGGARPETSPARPWRRRRAWSSTACFVPAPSTKAADGAISKFFRSFELNDRKESRRYLPSPRSAMMAPLMACALSLAGRAFRRAT
jgi:hypothetical protein